MAFEGAFNFGFLDREQLEHVVRLCDIADARGVALDRSQMGAGKTVAATAVARARNAVRGSPTMVLCPASVEYQWRRTFDEFGSPCPAEDLAVMSIAKARGKNGILCGDTIAPSFDKFLRRGGTVIVDEAHCARNITLTHKLVSRIIAAASGYHDEGARVVLLSGTLYDRQENAKAFARLFGILKSDTLWRRDPVYGNVKLTGGQDVIDYIRAARGIPASDEDPDVGQRGLTGKESVDAFLFTAVTKHIIPMLSSSMTFCAPPSDVASLDCANLFADMTRSAGSLVNSDIEDYQSAISEFYDLARKGGSVLTEMRRALQIAEMAKSQTVSRLAVEALRESRGKVVVAVNYRLPLAKVAETIIEAGFRVEVVSGSTPKAERARVFEEFQEDSDSLRCIVAMAEVIALGTDLDDTVGTRPRTMFVFPSFFTINSHQIVRRVYRRNTVGKATVRFVYCGGVSMSLREDDVLRLASRKAVLLRETVQRDVARRVLFADEYDTLTENKDGSMTRRPATVVVSDSDA